MADEELQNQTMRQKKILLAQSEHSAVIPELMKDCITQVFSIVGKDEFSTLVNALTLEVEGDLIRRVVAHIEEIKKGALHDVK